MDFNPEKLLSLVQKDLHLYDSAPMTSDGGITSVRKGALLDSLLKKWLPVDTDLLDQRAYAEFHAANEHCSRFKVPLADTYLYDAYAMTKAALYGYFMSGPDQTCVLTLDECLARGRCGPGASIGTKSTDFYGKMFGSDLSVTNPFLYKHYRAGISPRWLAAELLRSHDSEGVLVVKGSRLATAPKNRTISRTICTEPSLNMFYQLGAGSVIEDLLRRYHNIDLSLQPDVNREMARLGSLNGRFCTVDLKGASNTIASLLVRDQLPRQAVGVLDIIRSPVTSLGGEDFELSMYSSMGNGFTFPLQTLLFATLVRSAYEIQGIKPVAYGPNRNYGVFGDDIICTAESYSVVVQLLELCGFTVNREKSFSCGPFRESCGSDFFRGQDVRGVYLRKVNHESDVYSVFNRLARWSARHNISLYHSLRYLRERVQFRPVPLHASDGEGIKCPSDYLKAVKRDANGAIWYHALEAKPRQYKLDGPHVNYDGAVVAFVGGYVRSGKVGIRVNDPQFKVVRKKTPSWDFASDPGITTRGLWAALVGVI